MAFLFLGRIFMEQCAIFIDGGYLAKVTEQNFNRPPIDFQRLSDVLSGSAQRLRTYFYDCMPYQGNPPTTQERDKHAAKAKFIHAVQRSVQRFQFRQGRLRKTGATTFEQKRVDVMLGVDMVRLSSKKQIDHVILIAGDSDLVPAVEACKEEGAIVRLYYHPSAISDELLNVVDERCLIDSDLIAKIIRAVPTATTAHT
jgi:uncharacterized LabA/DUF88 family protein